MNPNADLNTEEASIAAHCKELASGQFPSPQGHPMPDISEIAASLPDSYARAYLRLDQRLDDIDASVFSGEVLHHSQLRELFSAYIARWSKALNDTAE